VKVLCYGLICIDLTVKLSRFPEWGGCGAIEEISRTPGGGACNVAVSLRRMGIDVILAGNPIGCDDEGVWLVDRLRSEGIRDEALVQRGLRTPFALVLVGGEGEPTYLGTLRGRDRDLQGEPLDQAWYGGVDAVVLDERLPEASLMVANTAQGTGTYVVSMVESPQDPRIPLSDLVILSASGYEDGQVRSTLDELARCGPDAVVISRGPKGMLVRTEEGHIIAQCAEPCPVVDATGAGDALSATIVYGLLNRWPWVRRLDKASQVAARVCSALGAQNGIPAAEEMRRLLGAD
jgi:sugar/nucleoside kinase (ribokinase family)